MISFMDSIIKEDKRNKTKKSKKSEKAGNDYMTIYASGGYDIEEGCGSGEEVEVESGDGPDPEVEKEKQILDPDPKVCNERKNVPCEPDKHFEFRTIDGRCNNLKNRFEEI